MCRMDVSRLQCCGSESEIIRIRKKVQIRIRIQIQTLL
jgi:hypothetical protein